MEKSKYSKEPFFNALKAMDIPKLLIFDILPFWLKSKYNKLLLSPKALKKSLVKLLLKLGILFAIIVSKVWLILINLNKEIAVSFKSHDLLFEMSNILIDGWKAKLYKIVDKPLVILFPGIYSFSKHLAFIIPSDNSLHISSFKLQYDKSNTFNFL